MVWLLRFYFIFMGLIYFAIGVWAILSHISFLEAVGLNIASDIGLSEIGGIYGGLNICIGIMCFLGMFKQNIGIFAVQFLTFLTGSIAFGRILFSFMPSMPTFLNSFFIFEVCAFLVGIFILANKNKSEYITKV